MKSFIKKRLTNVVQLINRQLNRSTIKNKVFCIGLHKTGTTTLAHYLREFGYHTTHTTNWINDNYQLQNFDFFSDGGSHFDNIHEFDFEKLFHKYKDAKFILQTRDTKKWIISKLKHAGWNSETEILQDDSSTVTNNQWKHKSLLTIKKLIEHKYNYEKKVISFFKENNTDRLLIIDITKKETKHTELKKLKAYLNLKSINKVSLPHANKKRAEIALDNEILTYIDTVISAY